MRTEIRFAGVGGQGSVLASTILAEAAGGLGGQEAVQTQFYEAAVRDGAAVGDIVLGDEPITFPWVIAPDFLIAQHMGAIRAHLDLVKPDGVVIADTVYATQNPETPATVYHAPLTEIADAVGVRRVSNMVALAVLAKISGVVAFDDLDAAVVARSPFGSATTNQDALKRGCDLDIDALRVETPVNA